MSGLRSVSVGGDERTEINESFTGGKAVLKTGAQVIGSLAVTSTQQRPYCSL